MEDKDQRLAAQIAGILEREAWNTRTARSAAAMLHRNKSQEAPVTQRQPRASTRNTYGTPDAPEVGRTRTPPRQRRVDPRVAETIQIAQRASTPPPPAHRASNPTPPPPPGGCAQTETPPRDEPMVDFDEEDALIERLLPVLAHADQPAKREADAPEVQDPAPRDEACREECQPHPLPRSNSMRSILSWISRRPKTTPTPSEARTVSTAHVPADLQCALTELGFSSFRACVMDAIGDRDYIARLLPPNPEPTGQWLDEVRARSKQIKRALEMRDSAISASELIGRLNDAVATIRQRARELSRARLSPPAPPPQRETTTSPALEGQLVEITPSGVDYPSAEMTLKLRNLDSVFQLRRSVFSSDFVVGLDAAIGVENSVGIHMSDTGRRNLLRRVCERFGRTPESMTILLFGRTGERGTKSIGKDDGPCEACGSHRSWIATRGGSHVVHPQAPCPLADFAVSVGFTWCGHILRPPEKHQASRVLPT